MSAAEFQRFWSATYPESPPVSHFFRRRYPERWLRIHSLPESKRYAENDAEWQILLHRQRTVLTDLLGSESKVNFLTSYCCYGVDDVQEFLREESVFSGFQLVPLAKIDLHALEPETEEPGVFRWPLLGELSLGEPTTERLLRAIARCEEAAFFIGRHSRVLVAPYDGGVDIILPDTATRDFYHQKYRAWLSDRADGL